MQVTRFPTFMASSGRYQSRLFNFVNQQSRRLTEQCDRAFRHLQVSASWGIQLILYPVYLLFQSKRSGGKRLDQTVQQSWLQLQDGSLAEEEFSRQLPPDDTNSQPQTPPTADTPIQRVLLLVDDLPSPEAVSTPSPGKTEPINFFAFLASNALTRFASLRRFKFFANNPKSTSSLTHPSSPAPPAPPSSPTPYSRLANSPNRPVVRGIATQLSSRTLVLVTAENEILDILTPQQQQKLHERIIGEMADYWRHQRLAHSAGLGKAYPTLREPLRGMNSPLEYGSHTYQPLAFLDRTVADLESNYLAPLSEVAITLGQRSWELVQRVQTQLISSFAGKAQPADSKSPTAHVADAHTLRIQALIWAAIDYFFGRRGRKQLGQTTPTTISVPHRDSYTTASVTNDIIPHSLTGDVFDSNENCYNSLELQAGSKPRRKPLPERRSTSKPDSQPPSRPQLISPDGDPWLTFSDLFGDPPPPEWIETNATMTGYVKHPLEQLLDWLDRATLWLEDILMIVWRWVKQLFRIR